MNPGVGRLPRVAVHTGQSGGWRAQNPEVSSVSRFWDEVWDFSNEDKNPALGTHQKKIYWSFRMPGGGVFTDPLFLSLLTASKQFLYAVRWHRAGD